MSKFDISIFRRAYLNFQYDIVRYIEVRHFDIWTNRNFQCDVQHEFSTLRQAHSAVSRESMM